MRFLQKKLIQKDKENNRERKTKEGDDFGQSNEKILQLRISIKDTKPEIWRRLLVSDIITFQQLHEIVYMVIAGGGIQYYEFILDNIYIQKERNMFARGAWKNFFKRLGKKFKSGEEVTLMEYLNKEEQTFFYYRYFLSRKWRYDITIEKISERDNSQKYPKCIEGKMASLPRLTSVFQYNQIMKIWNNQKFSKYQKEYLDSIGYNYNPYLFNLNSVNNKLNIIDSKIMETPPPPI